MTPALRPALLLAALGLLVPAGLVQAQQADAEGEATMVARINSMRNVRGVPALTRHEGLDEAARVHSMDMATHGTLSHVSPRTADPPARVDAVGVPVDRLAENIARGADVLAAHRSIISSEAHRAQLLDPEMTHLGISVVSKDGVVWVTQVLARLGDGDGATAEANAAPPWSPTTAPPPAAATKPAPAAPEAPAEAPAAEPASAPEPYASTAPQASSSSAAASTYGGQVVRVPGRSADRPIVGYWVAHNGRWLYYPLPEDVQPGQRLTHDPRVQGPAVDRRYPQGYRYPVYREGYRQAEYPEGYRQADYPCQTWQCQYYRQRGF